MISTIKTLILTSSLALSLSSFTTARDENGCTDGYCPRMAMKFAAAVGVYGDPHFQTWSGESYDFHGICDLVLVKNPNFEEGLGMDIHIRSMKMHKMFSYVDGASVRIGDTILEVKGGRPEKRGFWVNGVATAEDETVKLSGKYPVVIEELGEKSRKSTIRLGGDETIEIQTWNAMVRVNFKNASSNKFDKSLGMMGAFSTGEKLARDGITEVHDFNKFVQEWQVLPTEPKLFHEVGGVPQSTASCDIPSSSDMRRRLGEVSITAEEAETACSQVEPALFDMCVFDIMVSNDKDLVGAY